MLVGIREDRRLRGKPGGERGGTSQSQDRAFIRCHKGDGSPQPRTAEYYGLHREHLPHP